jgi:competence protein ComEC
MSYILFIILSLISFLRFLALKPNFQDGAQIRINQEKIRSEPLRFERSQQLEILGLRANLPLYPEVNYGDTITIEGRVNLKKKTLEEPKIISLEKGGLFYQIRQNLILFYKKYLPEPHSSLVAGMVLGSKSGLPADFWEDLKKTGTAHVVVASGMNVSLIAGFLSSLFIVFVKRRYALIFSILGIWIYAFFVGFEAPIIRASIMGSISFAALVFGRMNLALRALFISFFAMIIFNPLYIYDVGFILSFAATLSLILFEKKISNHLNFIPPFLKEGFSTSISAQILVAPILYFTFGYFSIWSPLVNGLVLWTVPYITILGMIAAFLSFFPLLGRFILFLIYPLTFWFVGLVKIFARI